MEFHFFLDRSLTKFMKPLNFSEKRSHGILWNILYFNRIPYNSIKLIFIKHIFEYHFSYLADDYGLFGSFIQGIPHHYTDVIMGTIAPQIISLTIVYSTVYSDADQRKYQSSASLAFVREIHRTNGQ